MIIPSQFGTIEPFCSFFLKINIAVAIANGGITTTAVIGAAFPSVNAAVAKTYAALLNGPPYR